MDILVVLDEPQGRRRRTSRVAMLSRSSVPVKREPSVESGLAATFDSQVDTYSLQSSLLLSDICGQWLLLTHSMDAYLRLHDLQLLSLCLTTCIPTRHLACCTIPNFWIWPHSTPSLLRHSNQIITPLPTHTHRRCHLARLPLNLRLLRRRLLSPCLLPAVSAFWRSWSCS